MTELELVARLAPDIPLDDDYARAARARALARLARDTRPARGRKRRRSRVVLLACAGALAAAALLLLTRVGGQESAIARARAALALLPATGILVVDSHSAVTAKSGRLVVYHYASWGSLDHPADRRFLQTDPERGTLVDRSSLRGLVMRYDRRRNAVFTQRVIVSPNAAAETEGVLAVQQRVRALLASRDIRDLGETRSGGRTYRKLSLVHGRVTCEYLVDAGSFQPARLDCITAAGGGGRRVHDIVTYRVVPSTAANERLLDLRVAYPNARVEHDPNGIPGRAGHDLADVTQPVRYPWTIHDSRLRRTDDAALRLERKLESAATRAEIACLARHGSHNTNGNFGDDPTGTISAICRYRQDDAAALARTPAGREFYRRQGVAAAAAWQCIRAATRQKPRLGALAKRALERRCARTTRDPVAGGLEVPKA